MQSRLEMVKKSWLQISLIVCFGVAIVLLVFLDYFNLERIDFFNRTGFLFDYTWKGRLFLLFFFWIFALESLSDFRALRRDLDLRHNYVKVFSILVLALIPLIYIVGVNFLGFDQGLLSLGEAIRGEYWKTNSSYYENTLQGDWPLSVEYVVFTVSALAVVLLAYGKKGLRTFSIALALVAGIGVVYMIDTMYPYGAFKPFQVLALPTAACAAVVLEVIGIPFNMIFQPGPKSAPLIIVNAQGANVPTSIAWPCAGVHSLFLYTIILLLLFQKSDISGFRKAVYFVIGAVVTYFVNVLRIVTYFVLLINSGKEPALIFHNVYGELYFFSWILVYILLIVFIQKYRLVEKTRGFFFRVLNRTRNSRGSTNVSELGGSQG